MSTKPGTDFARKLAQAPRTTMAAQLGEAERLIAGKRADFATEIESMIASLEAIVQARDNDGINRLAPLSSEIAGAGGLVGMADVAHVASGLSQLCDEMAHEAWSWEAISVFAKALHLAARPGSFASPSERDVLFGQLAAVRAAVTQRAARHSSEHAA
ncbi:MAG: hypothetical protein ACOYM8_04755 [Caulobacterales bacterium]|jgi:hypothetical protein